MHDAKLGIGCDCYSSCQTANFAIGTVKSHEDPGIATASGLVDQEDRAFSEADYSLGRGAHEVEIGFHFSEACNVWQVERSVFLAAHGTKRLRLHLDARLTPALYRGSEQPMAGWVSRTFDVKTPTVTLIARGLVSRTTEFCTEIAALAAGPC